MSLKDIPLKKEYRSNHGNVVTDFYIPCLKDAKLYQRAVGFFRSSSLVDISKGIGPMAEKGGKIHLVASPYLTDEDLEAIKKGYIDRDAVIENAVISELSDDHLDHFSSERLNLLANLIADGVLDIKIAFMEDEQSIGMYHEKMGIIEDWEGNKIAFSGSMNDSYTAMHINCDMFDVFREWANPDERERVEIKQRTFDSIWGNTEPKLEVKHFPKIDEAIIEKYRRKVPNFALDAEQFGNIDPTTSFAGKTIEIASGDQSVLKERPVGARVPDSIKLRDYQNVAINTWVTENYRGIFDMATGTGKTLTGLGAVARLSEDIGDELAVVICCPYQHLVEQWVEDIEKFNIRPIIGYSSSQQKDWKKRLQNAILDQKIRKEKRFFCLVTTNATFSSSFVQEQINKIRSPILLIVDEAHNFGAPTYARLLDDRFKYRLALSATLDRHRDDEGTALLYSFFGRKCIEYTLKMAIDDDKLTRYKYYPVLVYLSEEELTTYENISYEMSKCITKDARGRWKLTKQGEILALKRSRVVAGAIEKLRKLKEVITPYVHDNNLLVYCGATSIMPENSDRTDTDEGDIRQIEAVIDILGNELGMAVSRFTAMEDIETRSAIISQFQTGNGLQAIIAIKCLDEGVNIPGIKTAFILASTTNPKEYIQRRGRVLRKSPGKAFAEIYDFVTLPRPLDEVPSLTREQAKRDLSLVKKEIERMKEFGELSMNSMDAWNIIWNIQEAYDITDGTDDNEEGVL